MPPKIHPLPRGLGNTLDGHAATDGRVRRMQDTMRDLPPARLILGLDPGLHRTGYGLIEIGTVQRGMGAGNVQLLEAGVLRARAGDPLAKRLQTLHDGAREVLDEKQPDVVVIEDLFSTYAHPRSALLMAHARGVLMLAAAEAKVPVHHFTPNEVKQVVTGSGHASKTAMQAAVKARLKLGATPEPADVADALALALCFAMRQSVIKRKI